MRSFVLFIALIPTLCAAAIRSPTKSTCPKELSDTVRAVRLVERIRAGGGEAEIYEKDPLKVELKVPPRPGTFIRRAVQDAVFNDREMLTEVITRLAKHNGIVLLRHRDPWFRSVSYLQANLAFDPETGAMTGETDQIYLVLDRRATKMELEHELQHFQDLIESPHEDLQALHEVLESPRSLRESIRHKALYDRVIGLMEIRAYRLGELKVRVRPLGRRWLKARLYYYQNKARYDRGGFLLKPTPKNLLVWSASAYRAQMTSIPHLPLIVMILYLAITR